MKRKQTFGEVKLVKVKISLEKPADDAVEDVAEERTKRSYVLQNIHNSDYYRT